jgi:hypothetical protein
MPLTTTCENMDVSSGTWKIEKSAFGITLVLFNIFNIIKLYIIEEREE